MAGAEPTDEFTSKLLQQSVVKILENIGFTSASDDSLNIITDVMRRYLEQICNKAKAFAEHGGRTTFNVEDISITFDKMQINGAELHQYRTQTGDLLKNEPGTQPSPPSIPAFPVRKPGSRALIFVPPTEKERISRLEKDDLITINLPTLHLDYCKTTEIISDEKPSTSTAVASSPEKKSVKLIDEFPSFFEMDAIQLGIVKKTLPPPQAVIPKIDHSSATGIKSSANAYAKKLKPQPFKVANSFSPMHSKSARPSPIPPSSFVSPAPSPIPASSYSGFIRRVESTPNLDRISNGISKESSPSVKLALSIPKTTKSTVSPLVSYSQAQVKSERNESRTKNHVLNDIPVLAKIEPIQPSVIDRFDASRFEDVNAATPEYRMTETPSKDETSQPPILLSVKAEQKKDKKKKDKKKHKEKHKDKGKDRPASIAPVLEPVFPLSPRRIETPPMRIENKEDILSAVATTSTAPAAMSSPKIKITLRNIHSDSPSSAFSPPEAAVVTPMEIPQTPTFSMALDPFLSRPPQSISRGSVQSDSNTIPLIDGMPPDETTVHSMLGDKIPTDDTVHDEDTLLTTFPLNMSMDDPIGVVGDEKQRKKAKKKDKDRDRERDHSRADAKIKEKKRDKEHKKKKKKDKDKDRGERRTLEAKSEKDRSTSVATPAPEPKYPTLKIKLSSPSSETMQVSQPSPIERIEPVRIKLKPVLPSESESRRESLKMNISLPKVVKEEKPEKPRVKTKAELKAPVDYPPLFSVDTKVIRGGTPKFDKNRKSNASTPLPPVSSRNSPAPSPAPAAIAPVRLSIKKDFKDFVMKEEKKNKEKSSSSPKPMPIIQKISNTKKSLPPPPPVKEKKKEKKSVVVPVISQTPKKKKKDRKSVAIVADVEEPITEEAAGEDDKVWICPVCSVAYVDGATMVGCDVCDDWYHWSCVGLVVAPPDDVPWFCEKCNKKKSSPVPTKPEKRKSSVSDGVSSKKKKH